MIIIVSLFFIFIVSLILAKRSMKDLETPHEVRRIVERRKIRGTVVFTKGAVKHYRPKTN